jgi:hypothetical protein
MRTFRWTATAALVAVASLGFVPSSMAQYQRPQHTPGAFFESTKQACETAIDNRLSRISTLQQLVNGSQHVTADHRSTLLSQLSSAQSGLSALKTKIEGDTDATTLHADCRSIVDDYRIYVLVSPKVREVLVSDLETDVAARLTTIAARIQTAIDNAKAKGKDTTTAQDDLDQMKTAIASARSAIDGVASNVIDLTPSDWPGAHDTLVNGRQSLRTGRNDLHTARNDGWDAVQSLRQS